MDNQINFTRIKSEFDVEIEIEIQVDKGKLLNRSLQESLVYFE